MNDSDGDTGWKTIKQRLSFNFKALGCCGAIWSPRTPTMPFMEEEEEPIMHNQTSQGAQTVSNVGQNQVANSTSVAATGMNLAMALAAERNSRVENVGPVHHSKHVKTLVRLIEETDGVDLRKKKNKREDKDMDMDMGNEVGVGRNGEGDWVCCVCMERHKGAAFVPCGHTFCRICSREIWLNRGSCPICNRAILEILDIF